MTRFLAFLFGKSYEPCYSCITLKQQLEIANKEKEQLLDAILGIVKPPAIPVLPTPSVLEGARIPWHKRKQMLEEEDAQKAKAMREQAERLEKDLNLVNGEGA